MSLIISKTGKNEDGVMLELTERGDQVFLKHEGYLYLFIVDDFGDCDVQLVKAEHGRD